MVVLRRIHWDQDHKTNEISMNKSYLVKIYGSWYTGKFSLQWYGWYFGNWGTSGIQLRNEGEPGISEIYLIVEE